MSLAALLLVLLVVILAGDGRPALPADRRETHRRGTGVVILAGDGRPALPAVVDMNSGAAVVL